jgi:DNA-binding XRE family transcriptional regulator
MITPRIDWFRVITDLQRAGMTHGQQAKEVGVSRRTIANWQQGLCEPSYSRGAGLLEIHRSVARST